MTYTGPKTKRISHNYETGMMTYRFFDLVDTGEIDVAAAKELYGVHHAAHLRFDDIVSIEKDLPVQLDSIGDYDEAKMRALVLSALHEAVNNALEHFENLKAFLARKQAEAERDARIAAGEESDPVIMGDSAEEIELWQEVFDPIAPPEEPPAEPQT